MRAPLKALAATVATLLAAGACDYPYENFSLAQDLTPEELRQGVSFDFPMDSGYTYTAIVACRVDAAASVKQSVELDFNVISPNFNSYTETVSFPLVSNVRQQKAPGEDAEILFKRRGRNLDNQWGWRRGIECDSVPGRWRVIISVKDSTDLGRVKALGFSYKGQKNEQEQTL